MEQSQNFPPNLNLMFHQLLAHGYAKIKLSKHEETSTIQEYTAGRGHDMTDTFVEML